METRQGDACGKVILFGEHSVVYGYPAIAVPLKNLRITVIAEESDKDLIEEESPEKKEKVQQSLNTARQMLGISQKFRIKLISKIPIGAGLGSSAALNVALLRALKQGITVEKTAEVAYEMEKIYHGTPSGIDTAVSAYEKPIFFIKGQKPEFIAVKPLNIVIANTGDRVPTKKVVAEVREKREKEPEKYDRIMAKMGEISENARKHLEKGNINEIGLLMSQNQKLLEQIGVSSPELDNLISIALENGALGAKLSGAGKGGCIVAIAKDRESAERIKEGLKKHAKETSAEII